MAKHMAEHLAVGKNRGCLALFSGSVAALGPRVNVRHYLYLAPILATRVLEIRARVGFEGPGPAVFLLCVREPAVFSGAATARCVSCAQRLNSCAG